MKRKRKRNVLDEYGLPINCTGCGKHVLSGQGNQRQVKGNVERYCEKCWKDLSEEKW